MSNNNQLRQLFGHSNLSSCFLESGLGGQRLPYPRASAFCDTVWFGSLARYCKCPTKLSQYGFTRCFFKNPNLGWKGGCYRIRDVPLDDRLVMMDTNLFEDCKSKECNKKTFIF
ncbi:unnamed protein product [Gongylonema pulchrum]|uniref:Uncharacterized protein n=1 Tax=Gongylonema pulchrum TaxID=637853 RepID=A0A183E3P0_9BILA|nr:unnamed protein product [Gongylonema pulchrum]